MSATHDLERRIADHYLTEAPHRAPDWVLGAVLTTIDNTQQRRALIRAPWRFPTMNGFSKLAVAAVAVIAVGVMGLAVLGGRGDVGSSPSPAPPTAGPSSVAGPTPSPLIVPPALTGQFVSTIHGIAISHPGAWPVAHVATAAWTTGIPFELDTFADVITAPPSGFLLLASQPLAGKSGEAWSTAILGDPAWGNTCQPPATPATIDGNPAVVVSHCDGTRSALTWAGDRGFLIVLYDFDDQVMFERMLVTVLLDPEAAITPSP